MGLFYRTWRFDRETPSLRQAVGAMERRYGKGIQIRYWSPTPPHDFESGHEPDDCDSATFLTDTGLIEIERRPHRQVVVMDKGRDERLLAAASEALEELGGVEIVREPPTPEQRAAMRRAGYLDLAVLLFLPVTVGVLYLLGVIRLSDICIFASAVLLFLVVKLVAGTCLRLRRQRRKKTG